jgi:hypothetical protein
MNKRAMERQAALEMEAQALAKVKADEQRTLQVGSSAQQQENDYDIAGVLSARDKRKRDKERLRTSGGRRRLGN